jgi:uncharacterized membrane protein YeiB
MASYIQENTLAPSTPGNRILSIDVLRGFAVLGILIEYSKFLHDL